MIESVILYVFIPSLARSWATLSKTRMGTFLAAKWPQSSPISLGRKCQGPTGSQQWHQPLMLALSYCELSATTVIILFLSSVSEDSSLCPR